MDINSLLLGFLIGLYIGTVFAWCRAVDLYFKGQEEGRKWERRLRKMKEEDNEDDETH